jgi:hypothetical protein
MLKLMGELLKRNVAILYCAVHYYETTPSYIFGSSNFPFLHIIRISFNLHIPSLTFFNKVLINNY